MFVVRGIFCFWVAKQQSQHCAADRAVSLAAVATPKDQQAIRIITGTQSHKSLAQPLLALYVLL
jgi:hypothetical protein